MMNIFNRFLNTHDLNFVKVLTVVFLPVLNKGLTIAVLFMFDLHYA